MRWIDVDEGSDGQRLDNFLLKTLKGVPKSHVYRVIRSGEVRVNRSRAAADTRLALGDVVRLPPVRTAATSEAPPRAIPARAFPVLFEDEHLIALDKPAGVAVHGGSGVSHGVIEQLRQSRPTAKFLELVHRLDKETSGVLLVAKRRSALTALQDQFRRHGGDAPIRKTYLALVAGDWPPSRRVVDLPLVKLTVGDGQRLVKVSGADAAGARRAITLVRVTEALRGWSLLEVTLKTGRTHQIRVHLASSGHPIAGDEKYGDFALNKALARGESVPGHRFERMFLHAATLRFAHPASGEAVEVSSPLPAECRELLQALRRLQPRPGTEHPTP